MSVLDALAHLGKKFEPRRGGQPVGVAVLGDGDTRDEFHDEVGPALGRASSVEHLGDGRVVHESQGLALGLEAGHHLLRVHARLDDLDGHPASGLDLLSEPHLPHPTLSNQLQEAIGAKLAPRHRFRLVGSRVRRNG